MAIDPKQIELSPEMKQAIAEKAEQTGKSWTEILWEGIKLVRPRKPATPGERSFYDAMMADGAVGVVKAGLPEDLASNPKHMGGFGRDPSARTG
jgi:hypothetical protein